MTIDPKNPGLMTLEELMAFLKWKMDKVRAEGGEVVELTDAEFKECAEETLEALRQTVKH
jgi:hypothetical protein